jgi:hypothetical protein
MTASGAIPSLVRLLGLAPPQVWRYGSPGAGQPVAVTCSVRTKLPSPPLVPFQLLCSCWDPFPLMRGGKLLCTLL